MYKIFHSSVWVSKSWPLHLQSHVFASSATTASKCCSFLIILLFYQHIKCISTTNPIFKTNTWIMFIFFNVYVFLLQCCGQCGLTNTGRGRWERLRTKAKTSCEIWRTRYSRVSIFLHYLLLRHIELVILIISFLFLFYVEITLYSLKYLNK